MREAILIFKKNRSTVENFLKSTLELNDFQKVNSNNVANIYSLLPFLELVYMIDLTYRQTSDYYYKSRADSTTTGMIKGYLFTKAKVNHENIFISNPYISSHTGNPCVTLVRPVDEGYIVFDFNLFDLLVHLKLLEANTILERGSKLIYALIGFSLMAFSLILVLYAGYTFFYGVFAGTIGDIGSIFTPIIALTLGLAIFDLAKTVLEQEVFYKSSNVDENIESKILSKFLISIIIALSIEALMVVFKIALSDYSKMVNAFYLIAGVSLMIISLGIFKYLSKKGQ